VGFVIDASAALAWCFADEATESTNALLTRLRSNEQAVVPAHWPVEVANALIVAARRKRISPEDVHRLLEDLETLPIRIDPPSRSIVRAGVAPLAERFQFTAYDAAYLELAIREGLPLATGDQALRDASRAAGVVLVERQP
jgi:predicted nucleic acid-binding protein